MSIIGKYQRFFNEVAKNWEASAKALPASSLGKVTEKWAESDQLGSEGRVSNVSQGIGAFYGAGMAAAVCGRFDLAALFTATSVGLGVYHYKRGAKVTAEQAYKSDSPEQTNNLG